MTRYLLLFLYPCAVVGCTPASEHVVHVQDGPTATESNPSASGASTGVIDLPTYGSWAVPCVPTMEPGIDRDFDGLDDPEEIRLGTDPCAVDSDGDGFIDLAEARFDGDPTDPDLGLVDYVELSAPAEATQIELSFQLQLLRADIHLLVDTSSSMAGFIRRLAHGFSTMVEELQRAIPDASWGVSSFRNYAFGTSVVNYPYRLDQQVTSDHTQVQTALDELSAQGGGMHESSLEAIYQVLTGRGYDEQCNGVYDPVGDVLPFQAVAGDAFGGRVRASQRHDVPNSGKMGGVGFRSGAYKLIIYGTDEELLDPDRGDLTPGGCPQDSGLSEVVAATRGVGAKLLGVGVGHGAPPSPIQIAQMTELAEQTNSSYFSEDGVEQSLYFSWYSGDLVRPLMERVIRALGGVSFEAVSVEVLADTGGLVTQIQPSSVGPVAVHEFVEPKRFSVELSPRVFENQTWMVERIELRLVSEDAVSLATREILIAIPPQQD